MIRFLWRPRLKFLGLDQGHYFWAALFILCSSTGYAAQPNAPVVAASPPPSTDTVIPINLSLGFAPYAIHSSAFPTSFNGIGFSASASVAPWASLSEALEAGYLSQGQASMTWVGFKHYFIGAFQFVPPEGSSFTSARYRGAFVEVAPVMYSLVSTNALSGATTTFNGFGATAQVGIDQPFWGHAFASGRVGYLNSLGVAGYYGFYTLVLVGIPFGF